MRIIAFVRANILIVTIAVLGVLSLAVFTWAEYGYFCDQAMSHHERCASFWSREHVHDWTYNATSNWQSELLFGGLLLIVLRRLGRLHNDPEAEDI